MSIGGEGSAVQVAGVNSYHCHANARRASAAGIAHENGQRSRRTTNTDFVGWCFILYKIRYVDS